MVEGAWKNGVKGEGIYEIFYLNWNQGLSVAASAAVFEGYISVSVLK